MSKVLFEILFWIVMFVFMGFIVFIHNKGYTLWAYLLFVVLYHLLYLYAFVWP